MPKPIWASIWVIDLCVNCHRGCNVCHTWRFSGFPYGRATVNAEIGDGEPEIVIRPKFPKCLRERIHEMGYRVLETLLTASMLLANNVSLFIKIYSLCMEYKGPKFSWMNFYILNFCTKLYISAITRKFDLWVQIFDTSNWSVILNIFKMSNDKVVKARQNWTFSCRCEVIFESSDFLTFLNQSSFPLTFLKIRETIAFLFLV